ncbi:hypothetical protein ACTWP5_01050 [Streptomyces sp. 4N509B]|uniref:hypothetical protein n=1 Tax=Streptomyces sp. 4N509B TaxID=3457413 RepID=UPI003FD461B5
MITVTADTSGLLAALDPAHPDHANANEAIAADRDTDAVLTLDRRDARTVRPLTRHKAFRLLPADLRH